MGLITEKTLEIPLILTVEPAYELIDTKLLSIVAKALKEPPLGKSWKVLGIKSILSACSVMGRIPYFPQMDRLANGNTALAVFYKTMGLLVFSSDYMWSSIRIVNETLFKKHADETSTSFKWTSIYKIGIPVILGISAQVPLVALAYKYNVQNPSMVALSVMDAIMPIYSVYVLMSLWYKKNASEISTKYLAKIESLETDIITKHSEKLHFLLSEDLSTLEKTKRLELCLDDTELFPEIKSSYCSKATNLTAYISGFFLTAFFLMWLGIFTYEGMEQFTDKTALSGLVTAFTVLINASLIGTLFIDTQKQLMNFLCHPKSRNPTFITESLRPHTATCLKIFSLIFVAFQAMAAIQISRDYLNNKTLVIANASVLSITYAGSAYYPFRQLTDWAFQEFLLKFGKPNEKQIISIFQKVETIKELTKAS